MIQQGFGVQSLSLAQVFQWHTRFKTGRTSVDGDEHTERSTSRTTPETVARIQQLIRHDRRRTIRDIAEDAGVGYGKCQRVLAEEFGMHRVAAKFVPRILTARSSSASTSALNFVSSPPTMKRSCPGSSLVMTSGFTVTTLRQSDNPPSGKAPGHQGQKSPNR